MMRAAILGAAMALAPLSPLMLPGPAAAGEIASSVDPAGLAPAMRTPLGLYLTPADAAAALAADPGIVFVDVRDPIEVSFVGRPESIDANVPLAVATHEFNPRSGSYRMVLNPAFVPEVAAVMAREGRSKDDPVFVICRSGSRSAAAAGMLAEAGYTNVWNLVEGFEGRRDAAGRPNGTGWRNAGLPWTYALTTRTAWPASVQKKIEE